MIKNIFKKNPEVGLLPYISEPIFGFSSSSPQRPGWEIIKYNIPLYWKYSEGENTVSAVLDTGCDLDHEDLKDNLLQGKNFVELNKDPIDRNGHGTHVSSTIAAINNTKGIVGVAPKSKIVPVKVLNDDGAGNINSIADAVVWCANQSHIDFITMSLGSNFPSNRLEKAINYAINKNKIIFCAAGNDGPLTDIMYPARYEQTISIGAIDENFNRTEFSCSGESLNFLAPGHNIVGCVPNNEYAKMSGTSMSNPFAVGLACLLLSYNKKTNKYNLSSYKEYIKIFCEYAMDISDPRHKATKYQGCGIIQPLFFGT
jgi:subtilisin family serine protease